MSTANMVSRPRVGTPLVPSITAEISATSMMTIERVSTSVPSGSPSASANRSASCTAPNAVQTIVPSNQQNRPIATIAGMADGTIGGANDAAATESQATQSRKM